MMALRRRLISCSQHIKNLINPISGNDVYYGDYNHYTISNGSVIATDVALMGFKVKCKPNTQYTFSYTQSKDTGIRVATFTQEPTGMNAQTKFLVNKSGSTMETFTTDADSEWLACGFYVSGWMAIGGVTVSDFMLIES